MSFEYTNNLSEVRALAETQARQAGLAADRVTDFVIAVSEVAANTVRHARSAGSMEIWCEAGEIICEIHDGGVIADPAGVGRQPPAADASGGHGLWLVHQICDKVELHSGSDGTTIRLHMSLPPPGPPARDSPGPNGASATPDYRARRAEQTSSRLSALASATLDINAAETFDGLAAASAVGAARIFSAQAVLILEMPDGQDRRVSATPDRPGTVRRGGRPGLAGRVAESALGPGQVSGIADLSRDDWLRIVPDSTLRVDVCLAAARIKPGQTAAAIVVDSAGISGAEDRQILSQLTQLVALGIEALRSFAEAHLVALTLQRSFLPVTLPTVPGVSMAFRYLPASDQAEVGGDFYEALPWRDGVLVAIGDVQGHSLHAATVMGELRHALRAFVSEGHPPLAITGLVNEVLRRYHPGIIATLCLVLAEAATGELSIVNCGHMPPLLLDGERAAFVGEGGLMLGLTRHEPHTETAWLPPGGTVLLYTDGLVEDRQVVLDVNLEKLREVALQAADDDVEAFANEVMSVFGSSEDDVAMIALRRIG